MAQTAADRDDRMHSDGDAKERPMSRGVGNTISLAQFKRDRQLTKTANMRKRDPLRLCLKVHRTASRKQQTHCLLHLHTRQRSAKTKMCTVAERRWTDINTSNVETIGSVKTPRIS